MRNFKNLFLILLTSFIYNCKAQTQQQRLTSYKSEIIGTWESEEEPGYKLEFLTGGVIKTTIDNIVERDLVFYTLEVSCGTEQNNGHDIYISKRDFDSNDVYCDVINSIAVLPSGQTILSVTSERGKLYTYYKE